MCKSYEHPQLSLEQMTDEDLCGLAASGNRVAEEVLVTRYNRLVRTCARPFFLFGGDSEDLTQEGMRRLQGGIFPNIRGNLHSQPAVFRSPRRGAG